MERKTLLGIVSAAIIGSGCSDTYRYKGYSRHDVDQVFRDHNGYRTCYDDEQGIVHEKKYLDRYAWDWRSRNNWELYLKEMLPLIPEADKNNFKADFQEPVVVIKDLSPETAGFAHVLKFQRDGMYPLEIAEIHLPKDQNLSPGNEMYGGKQKTYNPMHEVK